jgi:hypothetical protein
LNKLPIDSYCCFLSFSVEYCKSFSLLCTAFLFLSEAKASLEALGNLSVIAPFPKAYGVKRSCVLGFCFEDEVALAVGFFAGRTTAARENYCTTGSFLSVTSIVLVPVGCFVAADLFGVIAVRFDEDFFTGTCVVDVGFKYGLLAMAPAFCIAVNAVGVNN